MDDLEYIDDIAISLDVDWAPDFMIDAVSEILIAHKVKATWFITHDSKGVQRLFDHSDLFEIGIHPNFLSGSTQGNNIHEILDYVMSIVPSAKSVRTHGMVYSAALSRIFAVDYGLENDSSIFLGEMPNISPQEVFYGTKSLVRLPYFWSDDAEMSIKRKPSFAMSDQKYDIPGLKILCFHPVHIYLNSSDMYNYNNLKQEYNIRDCTESNAKRFINKHFGVASLLMQIIKNNPNKNGFKTISEIGDLWRMQNKRD